MAGDVLYSPGPYSPAPPSLPPKSPHLSNQPQHSRTASTRAGGAPAAGATGAHSSRFAGPSTSTSASPHQSYHQPLGSQRVARERSITDGNGEPWRGRTRGETPGSVARKRERAQSAGAATAGWVGAREKKRDVFVDVVMEGMGKNDAGEWILPEPQKIYDSTREMWTTEVKYASKIASLQETVFNNIEELVPIADAFKQDLGGLVEGANCAASWRNGEVPEELGEVVLFHVQRMAPYSMYLRNVAISKTVSQHLMKENEGFKAFVQRASVLSRESTQATGGFEEILAEPFQRLPRYLMFLDQILTKLEPSHPSYKYLVEAHIRLSEICAMEIDDETRNAAQMWALSQSIEGLRADVISSKRDFLAALDCVEQYEASTGMTVNLQCSLLLFTDKLVILKRPNTDKTSLQITGLDNLDNLCTLHANANLPVSHGSLPGSPKKIKKNAMGYRGSVELNEVFGVDFGGREFGLVLSNPPEDQSERWCGRPERRYVVSDNYARDVGVVEKEVWLRLLSERKAATKTLGLPRVVEGVGKEEGARAGGGEEMRVWSCVVDRAMYDAALADVKAKLAVQVSDGVPPSPLGFGRAGPDVIVRVELLGGDECRLLVLSRDGGVTEPERIPMERVTGAIAAIASTYNLYAFPTSRSTTPGGSTRSRPRSGILSAAMDKLSGGSGLGASLKRVQSNTSKTSTVTSASHYSERSGTTSTFGSLSPGKNSPGWLRGSQSSWKLRNSEREEVLADDRMLSTSQGRNSSLSRSFGGYRREGGQASGETSTAETDVEETEVDTEHEDSMDLRRSRRPGHDHRPVPNVAAPNPRNRRRSASLPSVGPLSQPLFRPNPPPTASNSLQRPSRIPPPFTVPSPHRLPVPIPTSGPTSPASASASEGPPTSPMDARPGTVRRRLMGPRAPGATSPLNPSSTNSVAPLAIAPFERDTSPTPPMRIQRAAHDREAPTPSPARDTESPSTKRPPPEVTSPRHPPPAKKIASLASAESSESLSGIGMGMPRGVEARRRITSGGTARVVSGGRKGKRIVSNASTIRGSPPPASRPVKVEDSEWESSRTASAPPVEAIPAPEPMSGVEKSELAYEQDDDEEMAEASPFDSLQSRLQELRSQLVPHAEAKENHHLSGGLSRSPPTRHINLKAMGEASSPNITAVLSSGSRRGAPRLHVSTLLAQIDNLKEVVDSCRASYDASISSAASQTDIELLTQERDLLCDQMASLKEELTRVVDNQRAAHEKELERKDDLYAKLLAKYNEVCVEVGEVYEGFQDELEAVANTITADGSEREQRLMKHLETALKAKAGQQAQLSGMRRELEEEKEEKERLQKLLREHGIAA
ncbi:Rho guanyl-nucleotide exchange factor [Pseudohyphozyma bogoriensis]|nr:Rho guanyl-nucleotide exchange factor [Pseudohyphozyma bogoriensis]